MDNPRTVSRRTALGVLAGAAATTVAACSSSSTPSAAPQRRTTSAGPVPTPHSTNPLPVVPAHHARALQRKISGDVLRPGRGGYETARLLFDRRFDAARPAVIVQVAAASDIPHCLDFAKHYALPLSIRSGGHSYIGASTGPGMVIDLRTMSGVAVPAPGTATIGAGAALVDVYNALAAHGVSIPAGSCPSVGISGLTLGGGIGVVARQHGLTCDRLVEATVVTADGALVTCNASTHSDLFWALRGGGGKLGIVTSMTLRTHPADPLSHAYVAWPWSAAEDVVMAWQPWAVAAPNSLWSAAHVLATTTNGAPMVSVAAVMAGGAATLQQHIGELTQAVPATPTTSFVGSESYAATMMLEAGCSSLSVEQCHVAAETAGGALPRDAFVAGSDFFRHQIPRAGVAALVKAVSRRQSDPRLGAGGAAFDILGGAVDDLAPGDTAWAHRGALFDAQYTASWGHASNNKPLGRNQHSLAKIHNTVRPFATGGAYQNYADDSLATPQQAYYGANLARLIEVRRTYDPDGMFTQPQGVPLS